MTSFLRSGAGTESGFHDSSQGGEPHCYGILISCMFPKAKFWRYTSFAISLLTLYCAKISTTDRALSLVVS